MKRISLLSLILWIFAIILLMTVFTVLCPAAIIDNVAVDLALATMVQGVDPAPKPSPFDCPTCKDTGWIIHGDGHQTKCPNCDLADIPKISIIVSPRVTVSHIVDCPDGKCSISSYRRTKKQPQKSRWRWKR